MGMQTYKLHVYRLGSVVRERREQLKMSKRALASAVGCSDTNISLIEDGSEPGVFLADRVLNKLGLRSTLGRPHSRRVVKMEV